VRNEQGSTHGIGRHCAARRATRAFAAIVAAIGIAFAAPGLARAANPAGDIDQCRNGTVSAPAQCTGAAWVNGNLGETNSHYREADFVPFRATLTNLDTSAPSHTVVIQYDTLQGSSHAYDYLGSYGATEASADPTSGLSGLSLGNCFAVPVDLGNAFANPGSTQTAGCIRIWNGTITGVAYGVADAIGKRSVVVSFTASDPTVLIAWGGHIASQIDWGLGNSASSISGSPYHMRLLDLDNTQLGNQDRSIKAAAILPIPPTFTTQASPSEVSLGESATDTATLGGSASNGPVTGSVKFFVCGPAQTSPDCTFGGSQVGDAKSVDASGHAVSDAFAPPAEGDYCFRAEYTPDSTAAYSPFNHTDLAAECITVATPSLTISKSADADSVSAGDPIGFTVTVANDGPGSALGLTVSDPLPSGSGIAWSVDAAGSDSGCSIASGTLTCDFGDLAASASKHVHVTSPTTSESCKTYANTATADSANGPAVQASASTTVECAAIGIGKVADADTVSAGDQIGFVVTLTNSGSGIARSVSASDQLPSTPGTSWSIDAANSDGGWSIQNGDLSYVPSDLDPGASVHVHVVSPTTSASCGTVDNHASVSAANGGGAEADDSVRVDCPDLEVKKSGASPIDAGGTATFTLTVSNLGSAVARNVTLDDPLPAGLDWSADDGDCSIAAGALHCAFGDLGSNESRTVDVSAPTSAAVCGELSNTASGAAANEPDDALDNNSDSAEITVQCSELKIVKEADAGTVSAGDQLGFTLTVSNLGPGAASDVSVTDVLPTNDGLDFSIAEQSDPGVCSLNAAKTVLSCAMGVLGAGAEFSVHVVSPTTAATCGKVDNSATVAASNDAGGTDSASVQVDCPDVKVVKTADAGTITAGDTAAFTIVVSNDGPGTARNVTLSDPLPAGVDWSEDSADCSISAGTLSCSFGNLAPESSRTVHLNGLTSAADCGTLENTADVGAANEPVADRENNSDSASIVVQCPNLELTKMPDAASVKAGQQLGFKITVENTGAGTARSVHVSDPLPTNAGLAFAVDAAGSDPGCSIAAGALACSFGDLAKGESKSVHLVSPTSTATCGKVDNSASAASSNGGSANASSSVTVACPVIDLAITKTDNPDPVLLGDQLSYTLGVRNNGPDTATNVVVTDSLPSDVTFVSVSTPQGTCSGGQVVSCRLGTMPAGASLSIAVVVRPTATGTITNTAVVAGTETESNTANNTATADTLVNGRPTPSVCYALSVRPSALTVGHRTLVTVLVRARGKGIARVRVTLKGAGIDRHARTNARGAARLMVKARKHGLIQVRVPYRRVCETQQIGVAGAFEPRFTG
jgi:uncharacterized repeat protein (TIGR01451 family)